MEETDVPCCVSHNRLKKRKSGINARGPYIIDSGGFTELRDHGGWTETPAQYVKALYRYRDYGDMMWAAPQDWMCEEVVINGGTLQGQHFVGTHLSVAEHQRRTVENYMDLRMLAAGLRITPVLQGDTKDAYHRCADLYERNGIDLTKEDVVGLGSVCRRQAMAEVYEIVISLAPLRLHGFGVKRDGLALYGHRLVSSDSMAWSFCARRDPPLAGCRHGKDGTGNCANCFKYAMKWRAETLQAMNGLNARWRQGDMRDPDERWDAARYDLDMREWRDVMQRHQESLDLREYREEAMVPGTREAAMTAGEETR